MDLAAELRWAPPHPCFPWTEGSSLRERTPLGWEAESMERKREGEKWRAKGRLKGRSQTVSVKKSRRALLADWMAFVHLWLPVSLCF